MSDLKIIYKDISELKEYENNPRLNDDAVDVVANSIRNFGWKVPIVIDKDDVIVTGHTRIKAARRLGISQIPCIIASDLSPDQIKAYRLADNSAAEKSGWDMDKLDIELEDLEDLFNMEDFGFVDYDKFDVPYPGEDRPEEEIPEPLPDDTPKGRDDFAVIVHCPNERDAEEVIERMREEGRFCVRL